MMNLYPRKSEKENRVVVSMWKLRCGELGIPSFDGAEETRKTVVETDGSSS